MAKPEIKTIPQFPEYGIAKNSVVYKGGAIYCDPRKQGLSQVTIYPPNGVPTLLHVAELLEALHGIPAPRIA